MLAPAPDCAHLTRTGNNLGADATDIIKTEELHLWNVKLSLPAQHVEIGAGSAAKAADWAAEFKDNDFTSKSVAGLAPKLGLNPSVEIYANITAEPEDRVLNTALEAAKRYQPDAIIGLGGGSVMDIAKLVCVMWASRNS